MRIFNILILIVFGVKSFASFEPIGDFYKVSPSGETIVFNFFNGKVIPDDIDLVMVEDASKIKEASITNVKNLPQKQFDRLCNRLNRFKNLKKLTMPNCTSLKNVERLSNLSIEDLDISGCTSLTSLPYLMNLKILNASGCKSLKNIQPLYNTSIQDLNLSGCSNFDPKDLKNLPISLTDLNLSYCSQITNSNLKYAFESWGPINSLNLKGCSKVTKTVQNDIFGMADYRSMPKPMDIIL